MNTPNVLLSTPSTKAEHIAQVEHCLSMAAQCEDAYSVEYVKAALQYGEGGPFAGIEGAPRVSGAVWVSGGTWSHWPDNVKTQVAQFSRAAHTWRDRAFAHHAAAGRRTHTLRNRIGANTPK